MSVAHDRYLVTTRKKNGRARTQVWESGAPLAVADMTWILEPDHDGVRLRYLGGRDGEIESDASLAVSRAETGRGRTIELPENGVVLELRRLRPLAPAYASVGAKTNEKELPLLLAFEGVGKSTTGYQRIHSAYVAYSRGRPVFTLSSGADGLRIKPLLEGLRAKHRGRPGEKLAENQALKISEEEIRDVTLVWGSHWWKFNRQPASVQAAAVEFASLHQVRTRTNEDTIQKRIAIGMSLALALLMSTLALWPKAPIVPLDPPEAPVVKFVVNRADAIRKPAPPAAAPLQVAEAKPAQKEAAKPAPEKKEPLKREPPKAVAIKPVAKPKAPKVTQPVAKPVVVAAPKKVAPPDPRVQAQAASQARLKALREALGGAKSLTQAASPQGDAGGGGVATGGFEGGSVKVGQTQVRAGYTGSKSGVATAGGGAAGGVGYASGDRANVKTSGGGFVAMDSGGAQVQEGLSRDEVGKVIHSHLDEIRYCHEAAMLYKPGLEGRIAVEFSINAQGRVVAAGVQSSNVDERSLPTCIISKLKTWQFPKPKGGVTVKVAYPFNFKAIARDG